MSIKKKLGMGIATGVLAVGLIGGGTFAYFSDTEVNAGSFAAGTLDIDVKGNDTNNAIIKVDNIKPGDTMTRDLKLNNVGSLDISKVLLTSKYTVKDAKGDNKGADFGEYIKVKLINKDSGKEVIRETTLKKLSEAGETDLLRLLSASVNSALGSGKSINLQVKFEFVDNNKDQNVFQGDSLTLDWIFDAKQTKGEER
ncbi:TasA family protein [Virgibacillus sp. 179-BFC.A HS]|uniref:TasA family protein n=1 Tax=Tigheibacillus jepli TaxID=3035914 RepID=A0ABU5CES3_9BACI|nr:TasA family protein [Virgibacillus sp. 179-BFC.A HS]MDY0404814.1 TasA family protein [Virgibacillus sp. 179-BFC.A HS]